MIMELELPNGWGRATLFQGSRVIGCGTGVRAYDHRGRRLLWKPPDDAASSFAACDVECRDRDCLFLATRLATPPTAFPIAWVATEVQAKLADVPVLIWLRDRGLSTLVETGEFSFEFPRGLRVRTASLLLMSHGIHALAFGIAR